VEIVAVQPLNTLRICKLILN